MVKTLQETLDQLDGAAEEVVVDFSGVARIDADALEALEQLADAASAKSVKVVLRGVNIDVYKVLKLMKLAPRFAYVS
jgi:anti-anti-sigma regulatory factor